MIRYKTILVTALELPSLRLGVCAGYPLKTDLTTGDFIKDPAFNCSDYDFDFKPNNELKAQGLVGAIRCIIRDAKFGVGYFREIPFSGS